MKREISFLTIHPKLISHYLDFGVIKRARNEGVLQTNVVNLRDFAVDKHGRVDDRPYGGGDGMIMRPEPIADALDSLSQPTVVILPTPVGRKWNQADAKRLAECGKSLTFICPRFGGVDERVLKLYDVECYSMGDFIVSGGELPALMMADSVIRWIPGALGKMESAENDSFSDESGQNIEAALYTRPEVFRGECVPEVLMSGDHQAIDKWRVQNSQVRRRIQDTFTTDN